MEKDVLKEVAMEDNYVKKEFILEGLG